MGIVNAGKLPVYDDIPLELRDLLTQVILNESPDGNHVDRLIDYAKKEKERLEELKEGGGGVKKEKKVEAKQKKLEQKA